MINNLFTCLQNNKSNIDMNKNRNIDMMNYNAQCIKRLYKVCKIIFTIIAYLFRLCNYGMYTKEGKKYASFFFQGY